MPGIFGLINKKISDSDDHDRMTAMALRLVFTPEQEVEIFRHKWYYAGTVGYDKSFSFLKKASAFQDGVLLIMDGEIFPDMQDVPHELADEAPTIQRARYCLYNYIKYGVEFVRHLNGTFVIAVFDNRDHKIHIYNDRFGSEPIYIWTRGDEFAFSTSQRSLLGLRDDIGRQYDKDALAELLVFERILGHKTLFQDIHRLVPASHAIWDGKQLKVEKYWNISHNPKTKGFKSWKDAAVELNERLGQSVEKRFVDNARTGALISGGIDSRLLLTVCPTKTIAATFSNRNHSLSIETLLAEKISKLLGYEHILIDREIDHYANVAELAVDVNESERSFAGCHSLGLHEKMIDAGIRVVITGQFWDTFFKGMYSTDTILEDVYRDEPYILKARRVGRRVADSLILRRQKHQDLMMLALSREMKERAAVGKERAIYLMQSLCEDGNSLDDCSEKFRLHDLQSTASIGFLRALRTVFPDRSPAYDNNLLALALSIPVGWKKDGQIMRMALKLANPKLAWINDANTKLPAGLCPPWNRILGSVRQSVRNTGKQLARYSKSISRLRQPEQGRKVFSQNSSWHDRDGLLRFSNKYRSMVEKTVNRLDGDIFDRKVIIKLLNNDLNAPAPRLYKLWEIILTFGLFDQKYGPNVDRNADSARAKNVKLVNLFP